jgi:hypothetical protein
MSRPSSQKRKIPELDQIVVEGFNALTGPLQRLWPSPRVSRYIIKILWQSTDPSSIAASIDVDNPLLVYPERSSNFDHQESRLLANTSCSISLLTSAQSAR